MNDLTFEQVKGKKLQEYKDKHLVDQELKLKHQQIGNDIMESLR